MFQKILPYLILVPLILVLGYCWSSSQLTNEGDQFQNFLNEVQPSFPKLKAETHEADDYFPCLFGTVDGVKLHLHHAYRHPDSRKGHLFLKIWQEDSSFVAPLKVYPSQKGLKIETGQLSKQDQEALEQLKIKGWLLSIKDNVLKFEEIPYLNKYDANMVIQVQQIIRISIDLYKNNLN